MTYTPAPHRYDNAALYRPSGRWGLQLPRIALGLWHNFGQVDGFANGRAILLRSFDLGITHFENLRALDNTALSDDELLRIDAILDEEPNSPS